MKKFLCLAFLLVVIITLQAQNTTLSPSVLSPPRLSYDAIIALTSPQEGDMVFDTTYKCLRVYIDGKWLCSTPNPNNYTPNMVAIASAGGTGNEYGQSIAVDNIGNVYITGFFSGTTTFGSTSKTSLGNTDIYLAKYSKSGSLQWVQFAGGTAEDFGYGIAVDSIGNVYITGFYQGTVSFDYITKTSTGGYDIFVAKYNSNGSVQWVQSAGGVNDDKGHGIVVDSNGNSYITGYYNATANFGSVSTTSYGATDFYIAKYDTNGQVQWVQSAGGTMTDIAYAITLDKKGDVYVTGMYQGTTHIGPFYRTSAGANDIFAAKLNTTTMGWGWAMVGGGTSNDIGQSIAVDSSGNAYVAGIYAATATFGNTGISKTSIGQNDIFIAKTNSNGSVQWVQSAGGTSYDYLQGIAVDALGNASITGFFYDIAIFSDISKTFRSQGHTDIFVANYTTDGYLKWVHSGGGTYGDTSNAITIDSNGNTYITGTYATTATFDRNTIRVAGGGDVFIIRIDK